MRKNCLILGSVVSLFFNLNNGNAQSRPDFVTEFIKKNPDRASISISFNDSIILAKSDNRKMPLASTVKIIIAIEYAKQVANKTIDPLEQIAITEVELFHFPDTDGGSHETWLNELKEGNHIHNGKISLEDIAKGMIKHSCNANTEYLIWRLGAENINTNIEELHLKSHDKIFPYISGLMLLNNSQKLSKKKFYNNMRNMSQSEYIIKCFEFQKLLKSDTNKLLNRKIDLKDEKLEKIWSDRLPGSTTSDYLSIIQKLNNHKFYSTSFYQAFDPVMEWVLETPENKANFTHFGIKSGITQWVLTYAVYVTSVSGARIEYAYFFNNLKPKESKELQSNFNNFLLTILNGPSRKALVNELK